MNCWWIRKEGKCHLYTAWKHVYHQANTHERSEYSLTCFPIYSLQSALPWMFTHQNVNNLVFASQVIISSKLQTYLDHLRWGTVGKCTIEDWIDVLFYSLQLALALVFTHRNVNSLSRIARVFKKNLKFMYPAFNFPFLFQAIWWTSIDDLTNNETRSKSANLLSHLNLNTSQNKT